MNAVVKKSSDGTAIPIAATINPILKDGEFHGWVMSFRDIRERQQFEKDILEARWIAEKANQAKSEFLAHVSHEIRTPMMGILGMAEVALDGNIPEEEREHIELVHKSAENLLGIINDILDLSKIESGQLTITPIAFSLHSLIKEVTKVFEIRCQQKNINLHLDIDTSIPEWIFGDDSRIRQVLINLLGNAIKFTEEGHIHLKIRKKFGNTMEIQIIDSGIGIPEDKIGDIFEAFRQADSFIERQYGGTGLGLTICKKIVNKMGGNIQVQSTVGKGSNFSFTLPYEVPSSELIHAAHKEMDEYHSIKKLKILLAEDNIVNQKFFQIVMKNAGHFLMIAENGEEAVKLADSHKNFDIIFMDIQMPKMNGFQATEELRKKGFTCPIVGLSAHAMEGFKNEVLQRGFTDFLSKPISGKSLLKYINKTFNFNNTEELKEDDEFKTFSSKDLEKNFGWTSEEFFQFLVMMDSQLTQSILEIHNGILANNAEAAHKSLHALKGTLGVIQAKEAHQICKEMDDAAKIGNIEVAKELFPQFEKIIQQIQKESQEFLHRGEKP
ncbi:MAG TPA: ATP-binding protein [Ignavibacteriaceae bacterium]